MGRLLIGSEWYDLVSSASVYEADFEAIIKQHAGILFPEFHLIPYKRTVYAGIEGAAADFALVERNYRGWWVVEAELASHSLKQHVEPQVAVLARAKYRAADALYLLENMPDLDKRALVTLTTTVQPRVFVLVNETCPTWPDTLKKWDALVGVVEQYRSFKNNFSLRVGGDFPAVEARSSTTCRVSRLLKNPLHGLPDPLN